MDNDDYTLEEEFSYDWQRCDNIFEELGYPLNLNYKDDMII